jgi:uncharacterized membrane protein
MFEAIASILSTKILFSGSLVSYCIVFGFGRISVVDVNLEEIENKLEEIKRTQRHIQYAIEYTEPR